MNSFYLSETNNPISDIKVKDLYQIGGILNIEGGYPGIDLKSTSGSTIWANLVLVLDRPLLDHVLFEDLIKNNPYPCLENAIEDINERQLFASYLMIISYYVDQGHRLANLNPDQSLRITVHVHQDIGSQPFVDLIRGFATPLAQTSSKLCEIDYRLDQPHYQASSTNHNYNGTHILISLSQCAGLDLKFPAGSLVVPHEFIPFHLDYNTVYPSRMYTCDNHLLEVLPEILASSDHKKAVEYINLFYTSNNPHKDQIAQLMTLDDFHQSRVLQVDRLWNPVDEDELIKVCDYDRLTL